MTKETGFKITQKDREFWAFQPPRAVAAPDPKREADRCNAEAYLAKPFNAEQFLQLVRRFST